MSIAFERAKKTYLGFLQARGKSINTVKNYACDLGTLAAFCERHALDFLRLGLRDLEAYHASLRAAGLRPNSRRRKLITAKSFLRYLSGRMDVSTVGSERVIPPEKIEKPPRLVPRAAVSAIAATQPDTDPGWRNRALIGVLLDTGMLVTEALQLSHEDVSGTLVRIPGKRARAVRIGTATAKALRELARRMKGEKHFFFGYSRSGRNAEKLTPRGVEVLFKAWAEANALPALKPRTLRHLFVVEELRKGRGRREIMACLGLKTPYAFRVYEPIISRTSATYRSETGPETKPDHP